MIRNRSMEAVNRPFKMEAHCNVVNRNSTSGAYCVGGDEGKVRVFSDINNRDGERLHIKRARVGMHKAVCVYGKL